jgi:hypothetical protein
MQKLFTIAAALALAGSMACGKSEAEKQAELAAVEAQKAADAAAKVTEAAAKATENAGQEMAKGMEDFAKAMQGMGAAMAGNKDGKPVELVTFQALETTLPQVDGWTMKKPRGERMTSPIGYSATETTYTRGDSRIDAKVVDSGFSAMLIAPWSMMLATGFSRESSDGYEKAVSVQGQPGFEKWENDRKSGELNVLVDKRFLVSFDGDKLPSPAVLHELAGKMDFARFATLK